MRFLVDECTGPVLALWLERQGHDVFSVYDQARGLDDDQVIEKAFEANRILITNDKDFGEKIFREGLDHRGVILLRLKDERNANKIFAIQRVLADYLDRLANHFTVVTETKIRISGK
jgi:predicted nuclease of predicted toxin-antitoxin system